MDLTNEYPPISDYGLISNMRSCALVSRQGSIDWCCLPRFDCPSVFGRVLDWRKAGYFQIVPRGVRSISRRYLPETTVMETTFRTDGGAAVLTDFMPVTPPLSSGATGSLPEIVRVLECTSGSCEFELRCLPRFDYGTIRPRVELNSPNSGYAHGGADAVAVYCSAPMNVSDDGFESSGALGSGEKVYSAIKYRAPFSIATVGLSPRVLSAMLQSTLAYWREWSSICQYEGEFRDDVLRSALTLKALTYAPSGALLAAATTSLPELIGGERNWDYRFTWIRDATFALYALNILGYREEGMQFRNWLMWSTAGHVPDLQLMYGLRGERRLTEIQLPELEGYRGSGPVRIGNGAYSQSQLDIYGELLDAFHLYRKSGGEVTMEVWNRMRELVGFVREQWKDPDDGLWESRGGSRHFVFTKVWCWVALDRAIKAARALGLPADIDQWQATRAEIREDVLRKGYDAERGVFVQAYGGKSLDASNLMLPLVGFIRADDPRMRATIEATKRELTSPNGLVYRYRGFDDGLEGSEGTFTICTFWLVDNLIKLGELEEARTLFNKMRSHASDLGLYSEEVDGQTGELLGNFPQAFSHLGLINTAVQLQRARAAATTVQDVPV